jgi:hypothetical protein
MRLVALTAGFVAAAALPASAAPSQDAFPDFEIPSVSLASVHDHNDQDVRDALFSTGIVAVTHIDGIDEARTAMFHELNLCALNPLGRETFPRFPMHDDGETIRYSTAATITEGRLDRMTEPEACPNFMKAAEQFRRVVDKASRAIIGYVDSVTEHNVHHDEDRSFAELVQHGKHLEHFHFFESVKNVDDGVVGTSSVLKQQQTSSNKAVLDMHTDHGFLIAFTPASYWHVAVDEASGRQTVSESHTVDDRLGFLIKTKQGLVRPVFPPSKGDTSSVVFMVGDALKALDPRFHAPLHTVNSVQADATRAWYGRMFVAPDNYGMLPLSDSPSTSKLGCTDGRRALDLLGGCDVDQVYCWHRCQPGCEDGEEAECVNLGERRTWDPDSHCGCFVQCRNATDFLDGEGAANTHSIGLATAFAALWAAAGLLKW